MNYIDPIGNDVRIISSNAPVISYDFVDQSDTFKYVIATTVANLVRNYNSKTDSEIIFRRNTMWDFQILFPTGEIITHIQDGFILQQIIMMECGICVLLSIRGTC